MFWSRVRKDRMLSVAREVLGLEWAHAHRKDKKATLATAMETAFAKADSPPLGVTKEGHAAALAWAPPGFGAFDTGTVDDGETGEPEAPAADPPSPDAAPSDEAQSDARQEAPAEQPEPAADAEAPDAGHAEQAAPSEPSNGASDGEAIAPSGVEAIDAMNAVPVAGGGPRVIVSTVGFENDGDGDASPDADSPAPPVPGNGHDTASVSGGDGLEIPAFLRRS